MSISITAVGNLVEEPNLRFSPAGKAVCNFRIACDVGKDKPTVYKDCICFNTLAENLGASLVKGDRAIVKGRLETNEWDYEGKKYTKDQIVVEDAGASMFFAIVTCERKKREEYTGEPNGQHKGEQAMFDNNDIPI